MLKKKLMLTMRTMIRRHPSPVRFFASSPTVTITKGEKEKEKEKEKVVVVEEEVEELKILAEEPPMAAVVKGPSLVFTSLHRPSPSLMMMSGLRSLPVWTSYDKKTQTNRIAYQDPSLTKILEHLSSNADTIRDEYLQVSPNIPSDYEDSDESALHSGTWDWHSYLLKGKIQPEFALHFPNTTRILAELQPYLFTGTPFGFCFFSKLAGQSTIQEHTSPINFRLRLHLPLVVPSHNTTSNIGIRVGPTEHTWIKDQALVLDDSYRHEVWNRTDEERVLLIVDIWHPDVRISEREEIVMMFQHAKQQGWLDGKKKKEEQE